MESNIFGKLLTSNIMLFIPEEYPDPQPLQINQNHSKMALNGFK